MTQLAFSRQDERLEAPLPVAIEVDPAPLLGSWVNTNSATTGMSRVSIARDTGGVSIAVWPADQPGGPARHRAPVDAVYANGPLATTAMALTARYEDETERTTVEANLSLGLLVIAACHTFKHDDGRSNYFSREFFYFAGDPADAQTLR
jgi:hypothetical protein